MRHSHLLEVWVMVMLKNCMRECLISIIVRSTKLTSCPPLLIRFFSRIQEKLEAEIIVVLAVSDKACSSISMFWKRPRYVGNFDRDRVRGVIS